MSLANDRLLGGYLPSFFVTHLPNANVSNASPLNDSVILHEFIHYFQDVYTEYGNRRFVNMWRIIKRINSVKDLNKIVEIENDSYDNMNLWEYDLSPEFPIDFSYERNGIVDLVDEDGITFALSVPMIEESMAHLFEKKHPSFQGNEAYPYELVESIFRKKIKKNKDKTLLWICFASLNCTNPAVALKRFFDNYDPVLETCTAGYFFDYLNKNRDSFQFYLDKIQYSRKIAESKLKLFKYPGLHVGEKILHSLHRINHSNSRGFVFLLRFLSLNLNSQKKISDTIITNIGMPLYYDDNGVYQSFGNFADGDRAVLGFQALQHIFHFRLGRTKNPACPLIKTCKHYCSNVCDKKPWRYNFGGNGCTYSMLWKNLDLPEKI